MTRVIPFVLSLSKHCPSEDHRPKNGQPFDKLRANESGLIHHLFNHPEDRMVLVILHPDADGIALL
jgi:hypothetical protein